MIPTFKEFINGTNTINEDSSVTSLKNAYYNLMDGIGSIGDIKEYTKRLPDDFVSEHSINKDEIIKILDKIDQLSKKIPFGKML